MANLETLEIQINGNAADATKGIDSLTHSLGELYKAIGNSVNGLVRLNFQLRKLKGFKGIINAGGVSKKSGASAITKGAKTYDITHNNGRGYNPSAETADSRKRDEEWQKELNRRVLEANRERFSQYPAQKQAELIKRYGAERYGIKSVDASKVPDSVKAQYENLNNTVKETTAEIKGASDAVKDYKSETTKAVEPVKEVTKASELEAAKLAKVQAQTEKLNAETEKLKYQTQKIKESTEQNIGKMDKPINRVAKSAKGLLSSIGRIFKTMMIRQAIRTLLNGAKEGLDNYYQYSQKINNSFASSMDKMNSKWGQTKNQIGAALGSALTAVLPILNAIASAAIVALNAITALFALLGGQSTYSQAQENMEAYGDSIKGAGGAAKQWLATFDELNVMTSGGGGGGGGSSVGIGDMFKEVQLPSWMVEWKPLIEAILGGVLGAIILPKIWEWIKKIFGLFDGKDAVTDLLKKLIDPESKMPDIGKLATDMGIFSGAAVVAAGALPKVREEIEKIVAAVQGIDLLKTLIELVASLLAKALLGGNINIKVNREDFDKFKKEFNEWKKEVDEWAKKFPIKTVSVVLDQQKYKKFLESSQIITIWASTAQTKTIYVAFEEQSYKTFTKNQEEITKWAATSETKKIKVSFDVFAYAAFAATKLIIDTWVNATPTKNIKVDIIIDNQAKKDIDNWVNVNPNKYIYLYILDQADGINKVTAWCDEDGEKTIYITYKTTNNNPESGTGNDNTKGNGKSFLDDLFTTPIWDLGSDFWSDLMKKPIWELFGGSGKKEADISDIVSFVDHGKLKQDIEKLLSESCSSVLSAANIKRLRASFPTVSATDIAQVTNWKKFSDNQSLEFLDALKQAFGTSEAKKAAESAGVNIGNLVSSGLKSNDPKILKIAQEWNKILQKDVANPPPKVAPELKDGVVDGMKNSVKTGIEGVSAVIDKVTAKFAQGNPQNLKTDIEVQKPTVTSSVKFGQNQLSNLKNSVESLNPTVTAMVKTNNSSSVAESIKTNIKNALKNLKVKINGNNVATLEIAATGGIFSSGQMFIANENGVPEMIGRFGNQTAVANTEQIVDGISKGVAQANSQQNALLMEQNNLLRGILQKDSSVRLEASAALGRVARQSLNMYGSMTGV